MQLPMQQLSEHMSSPWTFATFKCCHHGDDICSNSSSPPGKPDASSICTACMQRQPTPTDAHIQHPPPRHAMRERRCLYLAPGGTSGRSKSRENACTSIAPSVCMPCVVKKIVLSSSPAICAGEGVWPWCHAGVACGPLCRLYRGFGQSARGRVCRVMLVWPVDLFAVSSAQARLQCAWGSVA